MIYVRSLKNYHFISAGTPVIQGPSEVIFRPNEGPIELVCVRNTSAGIAAWIVNDSAAVIPAQIAANFPGHTQNGVNIVIVNATNNTEYVCVSAVDGMETASAPVVLYVAGNFIIIPIYGQFVMCTMNIVEFLEFKFIVTQYISPCIA